MEQGKLHKSFHYQTGVHWLRGRRGVLSASARPDIEVSSPPEFKGEPGLWTPEDLLVSAINGCLLMTFLAYAQREELDLIAFECAAEGFLEYSEGKYRITEVVLKPDLRVKSEEDVLLARDVLERAHRDCFISNSVRATVKVVPQIRWQPGTNPALQDG
jgi:organic hydroperoxide reductase OsmC/OhrA